MIYKEKITFFQTFNLYLQNFQSTIIFLFFVRVFFEPIYFIHTYYIYNKLGKEKPFKKPLQDIDFPAASPILEQPPPNDDSITDNTTITNPQNSTSSHLLSHQKTGSS